MAAPTTENLDQQVDLSTIPISPGGNEESVDAKTDGTPVTVFHDKDNFNVKHPLQSKWTLWFTKPPSGKVRHARYRAPIYSHCANFLVHRATTTGTIS